MQERQIEAARQIFEHFARILDAPFSLRLWDGTKIPLGRAGADGPCIRVAGPGVLGALFRRPSFEHLFRRYASGDIDIEGGDLLDFVDAARRRKKESRIRLRDLRKGFPWTKALPLLLAHDRSATIRHQFHGGDAPRRAKDKEKEFIQFHYDASNEFYELFLDSEMVYSCAYFCDWSNTLEEAQRDKLDLVCRKLRLRAGETFLDIGSGWGALLCHAAQRYGVLGHGVTLSQAQHDHAQARIERLGLRDRVTVALADYMTLEGRRYDKIASIGMYEHVGIANYPAYFKKMHALLAPGGIFLNHGITRRAKRNIKNFGKISPSRRVILKYIFPGAELDHIGHTLQVMESCGFEVHDVEGLRRHYARTCRLWHDRLTARREQAIALVGPERYRMWVAYLAGVTVGFEYGPLHVFQTVATRQGEAASALPPTRADLYREVTAPVADRRKRDAVFGKLVRCSRDPDRRATLSMAGPGPHH